MKILSVDNMALVELYDSRRLKNNLTLRSTYTDEIVKLYEDAGNGRLYIPKGLVNQPPKDLMWGKLDIQFNGNLYAEQSLIVSSYLEHIKLNNGGIIKSITGSGKTVMAISILQKLNLTTLIIVPTAYLMEQWIERLLQFTDLKKEDIGIIKGDKCKLGKVTLGMLHSLCKKDRYHKELYKHFAFVIYDEVHTLSAPTFSSAAKYFYNRYTLGLSATPRRKDGLEKVFIYHIGEVLKKNIKPTIKPKIIFMKYNNIDTSHEGCIYGGNFSLGTYYTKLAKSKGRADKLFSLVSELYNKGKDILLLSDRKEILYNLKDRLPAEDIGFIIGEDKSGKDAKIILATYGSAGLGLDIPRISALILATPRTDVEQSVGRILRGVVKNPIVFDITDTSSSIMNAWSKKRLKYYRQITTDIHWRFL